MVALKGAPALPEDEEGGPAYRVPLTVVCVTAAADDTDRASLLAIYTAVRDCIDLNADDAASIPTGQDMRDLTDALTGPAYEFGDIIVTDSEADTLEEQQVHVARLELNVYMANEGT
jgi:hypothetical protein